jgi:hypothetical protein
VPREEVDILDEAQDGLVIGELPREEGLGIPAVEDVAEVEDDGFRCVVQPWRALKRRLVLLMT